MATKSAQAWQSGMVQRLASLLPAEAMEVLALPNPAASRASSFRVVGGSAADAKGVALQLSNDLAAVRGSQAPRKLQRVPWYPSAYAIHPKHRPVTTYEIQRLPCAQQGLVYFQSLASMLPALCLDARPNMKVLDLCAAPGGKATLLATDSAAMAGHGHLLAVDNDFPRLQRLLHNARTQLLPGKVKDDSASAASLVQGRSTVIGNMTIVQADGRHLKADARGMPLPEDWDQAPAAGAADHKGRPSAKGGPFDRVLVDAPCSSSGRGLQPLSQEQLERHVQRQRQLLWNAAALLRNGGTLVYSTCSVYPQENEQVVQWLLDNQHQMSLVEVTLSPQHAADADAAHNGAESGQAGNTAAGGAAFGARSMLHSSLLADALTRPHASAVGSQLPQGATEPVLQVLPAAPAWSVTPGLSQYEGKSFDRSMQLTLRLLPSRLFEGFFIAKLRKGGHS